jgi:transcriptional regulator with XRE-family HTH domain
MHSYTLDEVKRKIIISLKNERGLSGVELAKRTGINRVTLSKYLKILESMGLIKSKSIGLSNLWYLDKNLEEVTHAKDILDMRNLYLESLINLKEPKALLLNALSSNIDVINIIEEIIIPSINTIDELSKRGNITNSEVMIINNIVLDMLAFLKSNAKNTNTDLKAIIINPSLEKSIIGSKILDVIFYNKGIKTYFLGQILESDPLFDIDLNRFVRKIWSGEHALLLGIYTTKMEYIQVINSIIEDIRKRSNGIIYTIILNPNLENDEEKEYEFYTNNISKIIKFVNKLLRS